MSFLRTVIGAIESGLRKLNHVLECIAKGMALSLAALITLFVFISVLSRNFFSHSFEYAVEGNQLLFMWMCFMGLVAVYAMDGMLKFEMLEQHVPAAWRRHWTTALHCLTLVIALVLMIAGHEMLAFAKGQRFSTMPVSYFWMYLPVPITGTCVFLKALEKIMNVWKKDATPC